MTRHQFGHAIVYGEQGQHGIFRAAQLMGKFWVRRRVDAMLAEGLDEFDLECDTKKGPIVLHFKKLGEKEGHPQVEVSMKPVVI